MDQLEFEQLIAIAIKREVAAYEFYKDVATRVDDASVKKIFINLAQQEMQHHDLLEKYRLDPTMAVKFNPPEELKVAESVEEAKLSVDMKPADAINIAMKKEQEAVEFYEMLAEICDDAAVKDTYINLANMERQHKSILEKIFVDIGYPESF